VSNLGQHDGDGIRYAMHLSAPKGGSAQMLRDPAGGWVSYDDYARLKAEVERLKGIILAQSSEFVRNATKHEEQPLPDGWNSAVAKACDLLAEKEKENARLKAEVERLRKAGDAVSICLEAYWKGKPYHVSMTIECFDAWNAAKEGKQS